MPSRDTIRTVKREDTGKRACAGTSARRGETSLDIPLHVAPARHMWMTIHVTEMAATRARGPSRSSWFEAL